MADAPQATPARSVLVFVVLLGVSLGTTSFSDAANPHNVIIDEIETCPILLPLIPLSIDTWPLF